ncbi:MAG TPA: hypothetical protein VGD26_09275, partial [Chitinophagaceae bacterium]
SERSSDHIPDMRGIKNKSITESRKGVLNANAAFFKNSLVSRQAAINNIVATDSVPLEINNPADMSAIATKMIFLRLKF